MTYSSAAPGAAGGRHQRSVKNLLLDRHFQLKYTGYLVGMALLISAFLGTLLWRSSEAVITQSREVVQQGQQVLEESKKVSAVVQMNIVKDPQYADNPLLLEAFQADAKKQDQKLADQQASLERNSRAIEDRRRTFALILIGTLVLLVVGLGAAGILVTHKVAGPIHKMKRQIRDLGKGSLQIPAPLRRGDELVDFFDTFNATVQSLRERQEMEIELLDKAIEGLRDKTDDEHLSALRSLRSEMQAALDA